MDRADRIIKINESLQKVELNEIAPLIGLALNALRGVAGNAISKVGGSVLRTGNSVLNKVVGNGPNADFIKSNVLVNAMQGAEARMSAPTTPGAPQGDTTSAPVVDAESDGTPGQNRPRIM